jgi:hypothetical protein
MTRTENLRPDFQKTLWLCTSVFQNEPFNEKTAEILEGHPAAYDLFLFLNPGLGIRGTSPSERTSQRFGSCNPIRCRTTIRP